MKIAAVSAMTTQGVDALVGLMIDTLAALPNDLPDPSASMKVYRMAPRDEGWTLDVETDGYRVRGKQVERIVAMTDLTNPDAVEMLQSTFKRMGVLQALEAAGVGSGDMVHFGNVELEWE
jgi:GTP-binding protein